MRSSAALNHGKRCVEELDKFDQLMGWTFRQLKGDRDDEGMDGTLRHQDDLDQEIRITKQSELSRTAFGVVVDVPSEFVAPVTSKPTTAHPKSDQKAKQKGKSRVATSSVYCKRAMGATASSAARSAASGGTSSHKSKRPGSVQASAKKKHHPLDTNLPRKDSEPVDFVYDIDIRRKLREEIDSERAKIRHEATVKEAELRAANKWVYDKTDRPGRKQAWHCSDRQHESRETKTAESASNPRAEAKSTVRASSAASSRSSSSSTHSRAPYKPVKSSIAPNVSEWRTQSSPVYPSAETAAADWKRADEQRRQQQWRDAKDVRDTIDDFEACMHQLAI